MGHYASEMPDIDTGYRTESVEQLRDWINTTVDVLTESGGKMRQADLEKRAGRVLGISTVRMPWVINNAIADRRIKRGGPGQYDVLTVIQ